jgi:hypothetical protein
MLARGLRCRLNVRDKIKEFGGGAMRWIVKTTLNGTLSDEVHCDGRPPIPERGAQILIPVADHYVSGVVYETTIDERQVPAVLRIICCNQERELS